MKNAIALLNGLVIVPPPDPEERKRLGMPSRCKRVATTIQAELMQLGFMLDKAAYDAACAAPHHWLVEYHNDIIAYLKKRLGNDRDYRPFYENFPTEVMEMSEVELFINAIVHYMSNGTWEPAKEIRDRGMVYEDVDFKPIKLGDEDDFQSIFTRLVSINSSLTEDSKNTVAWFCDNQKDSLRLPKSVPFKETLCILAAKGLDVPLKLATDVLRVAVYLSGGDVSLPRVPKVVALPQEHSLKRRQFGYFLENLRREQQVAKDGFKFIKFNRPQRYRLLSMLEQTTLDIGEMQGRLGRWLRLGEVLHPGEHKDKFPATAEAFHALRSQRKGEKIRTFHAKVNMAFARKWQDGVKLLSQRPGEFARKLDWMVRSYDADPILSEFSGIGRDVSSKVLFELSNHFDARSKKDACRSIMIKGKQSRMKVLEPLEPLPPLLISTVQRSIHGILSSKIEKLPRMGHVWIDERLKDVPVPFAMRSVNSSIRTYVRGTRIPFRKDAKVVRPFIHWFDKDGSIDLDLSASMHDERLQLVRHISFTNLKEQDINCCHSGDIRHRQGPCAEYIDIDIERCLEKGIRYVMVQVYNFNGMPMHTVKDTVFGLMERENAVAGEIFLPKTITDCMQLANEGTTVMAAIIDLNKRCYIWADIESTRVVPMLENTVGAANDVLHALLFGAKMSVYDLLKLHADNRGQLVKSAEEADIVLKWEDFVTSYAAVGAYMTF